MPVLFAIITVLLCSIVSPGLAAERREAGKHVHGKAELTAALDGNALAIELNSPLDNLMGFEHAPATDRERAALTQLLERLRTRPTEVVQPTAAAACRSGPVKLTLPEWINETPAKKDKTAHAHDGHDKKKPAHDDHDDAEHAEIIAEYSFTCDAPARLESLVLPVMTWAPNMTEIEAKFLSTDRQIGARIVPASPVFVLK